MVQFDANIYISKEKPVIFNNVWCKIFKEKLLLQELEDYLKVELQSNIFLWKMILLSVFILAIMFLQFDILLDWEIIQIVLNFLQKECSWNHRGKFFIKNEADALNWEG